MSKTASLNLSIPIEMENQLESLSKETGQSKTILALEALGNDLTYEKWKAHEIRKALQEADAGDFASEAEVHATFEKWLFLRSK